MDAVKSTLSKMLVLMAAAALWLCPTRADGQLAIPWHTIDCGGSTAPSAGGGFELSGTVGQPDAGAPAVPLTGGGFELVGGFWPGVTDTPAPPCEGDVDGNSAVNITDLGILLANFGASGPGVSRENGDLNGDKLVNITDLGILLAHFGQTCI